MSEIEVQQKKLFTAQYMFQEVFMPSENSDKPVFLSGYMFGGGPQNGFIIINGHLQLKSILSITKNEMIEMAKNIRINKIVHDVKIENGILKFRQQVGVTSSITIHVTINSDRYCCEFLRSKGYAVPWGNLTVEKLVELKYIQLLPNENQLEPV